MSKLLDQAVTQNSDDGWDFHCPGIQGSACGDVGVPFSSTGWPTKKAALARGQQHFDDHKGIAPMQELAEFRRDQGLVVNPDGTVGSVSVEDL